MSKFWKKATNIFSDFATAVIYPVLATGKAAVRGLSGDDVGEMEDYNSLRDVGELQINNDKEAQFDSESALKEQQKAQDKLKADTALASEKERETEMEKRRRRVKTLLSSQEETGMANVGTKVLLGG